MIEKKSTQESVKTTFFNITFPNGLNTKLSESKLGLEGELLVGNKDTLIYEFGYDINKLSERDPDIIYYPENSSPKLEGIDTNNVKVVGKIDYDIDDFRKQNVFMIQ